MEFKGTKGKWKMSISNKWPFSHELETIDEKERILLGINHYSTSDKNIDDCLKRDYENNTKGIANLLLISKAPEMLEMLNYFIKNNMLSIAGDEMAEKLIKEATEL